MARSLEAEYMERMNKRYICVVCNHIYDPALGDPDSGIPPGTAFENLPDSWSCPECGATKADFEPYEGA